MKKKICHITTVHPQTDVRIFHKQCTSLSKHNFVVYLLVANGTTGIKNGVNIIGVPIPVKNRIDRIRKTSKILYKKAIEIDASIYHFHDPEFLPYAHKLVKNGKKVIYDVHEDVPRQILAKYWIPSVFRKLISALFEKYENKIATKMSGISTATPFIRDRFLKTNLNTIDINNYPILNTNKIPPSLHTKKEVCYIGGIDKNRGLTSLIEAFENSDVKLNLAGKYEPLGYKLFLQKQKGWGNVIDYGFVDREGVSKILNRSFAGLVTLKPLINYLDSLPVKMFEYMSAGIPVISSNFPLWKEIIEKNKCGICVNPQDVAEISEAIKYLKDNPQKAKEMGDRGRKLVVEKYNWAIEEQKLLKLYQEL